MAEKKDKQVPNNVIPLASARCASEGCKAKPTRAGFCEEHFEWFKAGLITKEGHRALDFAKKYQHFMSGKRKSA